MFPTQRSFPRPPHSIAARKCPPKSTTDPLAVTLVFYGPETCCASSSEAKPNDNEFAEQFNPIPQTRPDSASITPSFPIALFCSLTTLMNPSSTNYTYY
jgi:hypothetical protein